SESSPVLLPHPPDPPDLPTPVSSSTPSPSLLPFSPPTVLPFRADLPEQGAPTAFSPVTGVSATDLLASYHITPKSPSPISILGTVQNPNLPLPFVQTIPSVLGPSPFPSAQEFPQNQPPGNPPVNPLSWADRAKLSSDKSLKRMSSSPPTLSPEGVPRVLIPDEVFERGALQHKDFIVGRFFGKIPAFKTIQNVLNYLWGKGNKLEIHMNQPARQVIVRIPSDYIREKVLKKRIWYVDRAMFHVAQWSDGEVADTSSLEVIPIWAHLIGVPFDLMTNEGLGWIADALGNPKEMDDWTKNLSSLSVAHVKVEADATKPFPTVLELVRQSGAVFRVEVQYPWLPPSCSHCKELGHIIKDCLKIKRQWLPVNREGNSKDVGNLPNAVVVTVREPLSETAVPSVSQNLPPQNPPVESVVASPSAVQPKPSLPQKQSSPETAAMDVDPPPPPSILPPSTPIPPPSPLPPPSPPPVLTIPTSEPFSPLSPVSFSPTSGQSYILALEATVMPQSSIKPPSLELSSSFQIPLDPLSFPPLYSIWATWFREEILDGDTEMFWVINTRQKHSWLVNKLLHSRGIIFPWIRKRVQNGETTYFWSSNWSPFGKLFDYLGTQASLHFPVSATATLAELWENDAWIIPNARSDQQLEVLSYISTLTLNNAQDELE
ncbi:hypothetical protein HID58_032493, partial [Brassica napus]